MMKLLEGKRQRTAR